MEISGADARSVQVLVRGLEASASVEEFHERALAELLELLSADAAQCYRLSVDGTGISALTLPEDSFHDDPMVIYDHPLDHPLTEIMLQTPTSGAWRVSDVAADLQWRRTHCYNLDFRPFGMHRHLVASAGSDLTAVEGYALVRSGRDFTERERDLLSLAQFQLATVERLVGERARLRALSDIALELVGGNLRGVAAIGADGRPEPLNTVAADLLPAVCHDPRLTSGTSFTARDVEVRHIPPAAPGLPAMLLLRDLARPRAVARLFGVTEQEHRTLVHLHSGCTATEAARRMGLSPVTVRGYIAALHRKLEAGHTAALLRRGRDLGLLTD